MKCELLAPAGNFQKLKVALRFGADAVYLGGKEFSLRAFADNFTDAELSEAAVYAHARGKKVYAAANIFARNQDLPAMEAHFRLLERLGFDGVLVSDLGALRLAMRVAPSLPIHISTQANTTNAEAARFFRDLGVRRVVLARELSLAEIADIHSVCPELELEAFVHGAMCISYSGRCYLSDYLKDRPSNRGECVQACRDRYEIRTFGGESGWMPLETDGRGTYLLNSRDLNMSAYLGELLAAGVCSLKIEGRMKSESYLATVVNAYRRILDGDTGAAAELETVPHREYTTAYALGENHETVSYSASNTAGTYDFIAVVRGWSGGRAEVEMRTRFYAGDTLEILSPDRNFGKTVCVQGLKDTAGTPTDDAKAVQGIYTFDCPYSLEAGDILRRKK